MGLKFDKEKCTGCGSCESALSVRLITILDDKASIKIEGCNVCGACEDACATGAIKIEKEMAQIPRRQRTPRVWVFAEQRNGEIKGVGLELLSKGRELAILYKPNYVPSVWT